jgi:hypothetical protein
VAISEDGGTGLVGGGYDNGQLGAAWAYTLDVVPLGWTATPGNVTFAAALGGVDQVVSATLPLQVTSGVASGWNITATSTRFTAAGGKTLAANAVTVPALPARVCATTCTLANTNVSYPYALPAGTTAPTATKLFNAAAGTGDTQTVTPTFQLAVPSNARVGSYTSTWTLTLQSGP